MAGLNPCPKSPKSNPSGKNGPEIPAPSIETGGNGEQGRGREFGEVFSLEPMRVHPFGGGVALKAGDCRDARDNLDKGN